MVNEWSVDHLEVDLLLAEWRWLCPQKVELLARNAFGDLFLSDEAGIVYELDIAAGALNKIAISIADFRELSAMPDRQEEWFARLDEYAAAERGLRPGASQCIAFSIPLCFAEAGAGNKAYVASLYEHLSFTGDVHRQMADLADGAKVRLVVKSATADRDGDSAPQVRN